MENGELVRPPPTATKLNPLSATTALVRGAFAAKRPTGLLREGKGERK
jgi:hypothetical protein